MDDRKATQEYDRYKSKGEARIAGFLKERQIPFQYEYPLAIKDRDQVRIWYPDFRLPDYSLIIEYFGMNRNPTYNDQIAHKIRTYQEAGVAGIYLWESSFNGDWQAGLLGRIRQVQESRLHRISILESNLKDRIPVGMIRHTG